MVGSKENFEILKSSTNANDTSQVHDDGTDIAHHGDDEYHVIEKIYPNIEIVANIMLLRDD